MAVTIVAELLLLFFAAYYFAEYYIWLKFATTILEVIVILHLLYKKQNAEYKIPWIVVILVVPYTGLLVYLMFGNPKLSRRKTKHLKKVEEKFKQISNFDENEDKKLQNMLGEYYGLEQYLQKTSYMRGYTNSKTTFLGSGKEFFNDLIKQLEQAKDFIFLEYFTIDNGFIWNNIHRILKEKVASGVEVRMIYDDMGTIGKMPASFYKRLRKEGIKCYKFNRFTPILTSIYNNRDHRKIAIIDGKTAYTGGLNLADEYANIINPYGIWKDSAIKVEGEAVSAFTLMFLQMYNATNNEEEDCTKYLNIPQPEYNDGYVHPFGCGPLPYYKEKVGEGSLLNLINYSKKSVYITTPYLIIDHTMLMALKNAAFRGVDVRIITPHIPDKKTIFNMTRSNYKPLMDAGVKIYEFTPGFIHSKQILVDDCLAIVGTINLDFRSLVHHFENGVLMYKNECIKDIKSDFLDVIRSSELMTNENFKMSKLSQVINALLSLISTMM